MDVGFHNVKQRYSVGGVIRDSQCTVQGTMASVVRHPGSGIKAELIAIRQGMEFCMRIELKDVHVFSDSSQATGAISEVVT